MSKQKKQKISARSQARSIAFQVLYSLEFANIRSVNELQAAFIATPRVKISYENIPVEQYEVMQTEEDDTSFAPTLESVPVAEDDIIEDIFTNLAPTGFTWELVEGVWTHLKALDKSIEKYAKNWRIDRLGRIELTILRIALFEMLYRDDIPAKVSITEALELTSQFAEIKARSFINGLLDAVHKAELQQEKDI